MYEIWTKLHYKLCKIDEDENIQKINTYKRGVYEFKLNERPKCKICGSDLKFIKKGKILIIDSCLNDDCPTNDKTLKKGAPIKWKAFVPDNLIQETNNKKSNAAKNSLTLNYYLDKGYSEKEAQILLNERKNKLINTGKLNKGKSIKKKYIEKYGEEIANKLLKEHSCLNISFYLKRGYTEQEAREKISKIQKNNSSKVKNHKTLTKNELIKRGIDANKFMREKSYFCIEYWLKRGYTEQEAKQNISKIQSANSNKISKLGRRQASVRCIEYWLKRGYTEQEAKQLIKKCQTTFSKEICIQKYGEIEGLKIFNARQKNWQYKLHKTNHMHCGYSKISQELFNELSKHTNNEIYYGSLNREYTIYNKENKHVYSFDYTDLTNKKIIEFQGDIYHVNPNLFFENDKPSPWNDLTSKEIWEKDNYKKQIAINNDFEVLYIWESDFRKNKQENINKCINFLKYE